MIWLKIFMRRILHALRIFYWKCTGGYRLDMLMEEVVIKRMDSSVHTIIQDFLIGTRPPGVVAFYLTNSSRSMEEWYGHFRVSELGFGKLGLQPHDIVALSNRVEKHCNITLEKCTGVNLIDLSIDEYVALVKKTYLKQSHA